MPAKLLWTPQAVEDLIDIYVAIGLDSPDAAERVCSTIEARTEVLLVFPRIGPRRPDIAPGARLLVEGPYLLLYELQPDTDAGDVSGIEIVRVVDGHRDLNGVFD